MKCVLKSNYNNLRREGDGIYLTQNDNLTQSVRTVQSDENAMMIFGPQNKNLFIFEEELDISLNTRGNQLIINGIEKDVLLMGEIITQLEALSSNIPTIEPMDIMNAIRLAKKGKLNDFIRMYEKEITNNYDGYPIRAKNIGQNNYVQSMKKMI